MGMVLAIFAIIGLGISVVLSIIGVLLFVYNRRKGRGFILAYIIMSILLPIVVIGSVWGVGSLMTLSNGAPTGDEYITWVIGAILIGLAPGSGLFLGGIGMFVYSLFGKKSPTS